VEEHINGENYVGFYNGVTFVSGVYLNTVADTNWRSSVRVTSTMIVR